ncbi:MULTISPECIES: histidine kinase [unclassified Sphingobacterium]|uniref:sensor histidine kinase n=1 Tax=unclassified Sphingobacterium TaxID=2609468 RepID=UPI0025D2A640|nr:MULTISPECIES: histidine kinase [unclassified Sphingobacterium]
MDATRIGIRKRWRQEIMIFCAMYILTMLHEWLFINSLENFLKGLVFFVILYVQAQIHRFFIFRFYLLKRYLSYISYSLTTILAGASVLFVANAYWIQPDFFEPDELLLDFLYHFVICIISTATIMALSLMQSYALEVQRRSMDQILLNEMNLKFLHAQLNPHFFFNMLNNLYGVSLTEPDRTPGLIVKLSELMRYQIENGNVPKVSLADEVNFIRNYIDLERERVGKRCDIRFICDHSPEELSVWQISPLLLIILVENGFKHSQNLSYWFVHMHIELKADELLMTIENSLADEKLKKASTQVGLNNLKQRLYFIYNGKFSLVEKQSETSYETTLLIPLQK